MDVCVVQGPQYTDQDEQSLVEEIRKRVGSQVDFRIVYVEQSPRTARGKLRLVLSSIPCSRPDAA